MIVGATEGKAAGNLAAIKKEPETNDLLLSDDPEITTAATSPTS